MNTPRVLIVDDNPLNVELAQFVLAADGLVIETATDAVEAIQRIKSFLPDLILMDIQMPGMDGLELTRHLKADATTRHIVIVAHTAFAMKGDEARIRAAGCDGYLTKPIEVTTFAAQVRTCLATSLARSRLQ
jgi:two-component system, cell cycle response regulator DivK